MSGPSIRNPVRRRSARLARLIGVAGIAGLVATCDLFTDPGVQGIVITHLSDTTLVVGTSHVPSWSVTIDGATQPDPRFVLTSSNTSVAVISANGDSVRIVGRGRSTIRATLIASTVGDEPPFLDQPIRAVAARVTVDTANARFTSLTDTLRVTAVALDAIGEVIENTPVAWESTDETVATVDAQGRIVSRANGMVTIRALVDDDTATVAVIVAQELVSYGFTPPAALLDAFGAETTLVLTPLDARQNAIVSGVTLPIPAWSSLDGAIASVDATGKVTANSNGTIGIVASAPGVQDTANITVNQRATTVLINGPAAVNLVAIDDSVRLVAFAFDRFNSSVLDATPLWVSQNLSVATVEAQTGIVRALGVGTTQVVAQLDGASDQVTITVTNDPVTLEVTPASAAVTSVGDQVQFTATVRNALATVLPGIGVTWSVGDGALASISGSGQLTSLAVGTTIVVGTVTGTNIVDTSTVTINNIPETVEITPVSVTLASINDSVTPAVNFRNARGDPLGRTAVTWTTSDAAIATVTADGIIVARGRGDATVTATSPFNAARTDPVAVTVTNAPAVITLNRTLDTLTAPTRTLPYTALVQNARGDVIQNENTTWLTTVGSVASIGANGVATALAVGTTQIIGQVGSGPGLRADTATLVVINEAVSVTVSPAVATIASVGGQLQIIATAKNDVGGAVGGVTFTWSTDDPLVATVSPSGLVSGLDVGTVNITATLDSLSAIAIIEVTNAPDTVRILPDSLTLASVNDSVIPAVEFLNALGSPLLRTSAAWTTDDGAVAQVTAGGIIIAAGRGETKIRARNPLNASRRDSVIVTVTNAPDSIDVSPAAASLPSLNQQTTLQVAVFNARRAVIPNEPVTWTSRDGNIVTVTQAGVVTAVGIGPVYVVGAAGTVSDSSLITVSNLASTVTITPGSVTMTSLGDTDTLTATARNVVGNVIPDPTVLWQTTNPGVVTVDMSDSTLTVVTAVGVGAASVSATIDGVVTSIPVTVTDQPATIVFTSSDTTLASNGDAYSPGITIQNALGDNLPRSAAVWSTSDANVVNVSGSGVVTAQGPGMANIAAVSSFNNAIGDTIQVTVTNAPASITLNRMLDTLTAIGLTIGYTAEVRNAAGAVIPGSPVTWGSSAMGVATIGGGGTALAQGVGTTTITGTTTNALVANATLVVTNDAVTITLTPARDTIENLGGQLQLTATAPNELGAQVPPGTISWSTLDPSIASVNATGLVTASATNTGLARIVASTNAEPIADTAFITVADAPQTVAFTSADTTLGSVGDAFSPGATIENSNTDPLPRTAVIWQSDATQIATVSNSGVVTAQGVGVATISMTSPFNPTLTDAILVTVTNAPDSVVLNSETETLTALGRTFAFSGTVVNGAGNPIGGQTVLWNSSDDLIASVSAVGVATAVDIGQVTITATVQGTPTVFSTATLTVRNDAATLTLSPGALSLASVGLDSLITATARNDLGNPIPGSQVRWTSSDPGVFSAPGVATIDTGRVTAVGAGTASLTAKVQVGAGPDSVTAAITVNVSNDPVVLDITSGDTTLTSLDDTFTPGTDFQNASSDPLPPSAALWITSNGAVATVSTSGEVTAQGVGQAFIKAVSPANSNLRDSILVTVQNVPDQVTINSTRDTLTATTQTLQYSVTVLNGRGDPIPGAAVMWNTTNGALVSVSGTGLITALGFTPDSVEITATAAPVTSAPTIVAVKDPTAIYVDKDNPASPRFGTVKAPYASIQAGIDMADPGDTVFVNAAATTYTESLNISSSIVIQGVDTVAAGCTDTGCATPTALPTIRYISGPQGITAPSFTSVTLRHMAFRHAAGGPAISTDGADVNLDFFYVNPAGPPTVRGRGVLIKNVATTGSIRRSSIAHVNAYGIRLESVDGIVIDSTAVTDVTSQAGTDVGAALHITSGNGNTVTRNRFYQNNVGVRIGTAPGLTLAGNDVFDNDSLGAADLPVTGALLDNWWGDRRGPRRFTSAGGTTALDTAAAGDSITFAAAVSLINFDTTQVQQDPSHPSPSGTPVAGVNVRGDQVTDVPGLLPYDLTARFVDAVGRPVDGAAVTWEITNNCDNSGNDDDVNGTGPDDCGPEIGPSTNADGLSDNRLQLGNDANTRTITAASGGVTVDFFVTKTASPAIGLSANSLTFDAITGGADPADQLVSITNSGVGTLTGLNVSGIVYDPGATGWLSTMLSGTTAPATLTVSAATGALAPGSYTATISVSSPVADNDPQDIAVTFNVAALPAIGLSTSSLGFNATEGGADPSNQTVDITNTGGGSITGLDASTIAYGGGQPTGWITGSSLNTTTAPATLTVTVETGVLTAGVYDATIDVTSPDASNSPQTITVTFTVVEPPPEISLSTSVLAFGAAPGGLDPADQMVDITNIGGGSLTGLDASTISYAGGQPIGWLSTMLSGTTAPATLTVSAATGTLPVGVYTATIDVISGVASNSPQQITVTFTISP